MHHCGFSDALPVLCRFTSDYGEEQCRLPTVSATMLVIVYLPFLLSLISVNSCVLLAQTVFVTSMNN